ncbi:MAG TPA: insulinase family protein [Candidatus Nanopusillus sp.]|nr:insulinase family protein [Candidatus Nanopusillus sp.]
MPSPLKKEILDNGLIIHSLEIPDAKTIGIGVGVRIGSIYEPEDKRGISHFLEHMMFKSNHKYTTKQINEGLELNGGVANAFTSTFLTAYIVEVVPEGFPKVLDILYSMFKNEKYKESEFSNEKKVVISELERYENDPESRLYDTVPKSVFGESDYGDPVGGYRETVESISKEDLEEFKAEYYTPSNIFILVEGNFNNRHLALVKEYFSKLEDRGISKKKPSKGDGSDIIQQMDTKNQIYYALNFKVPIDNFILAKAFARFVSGGLSSLVFQTIREKYGIGYHVSFTPSYVYEDYMIYTLSVPGFERDKEDSLYKAIDDLFETILTENLDEYYDGRKRRSKLLYEKERANLYNRLMSELKYLVLFEKTYDDIYKESLQYSLIDFRRFLKNLENGKIVKIIPKS